MIEPDVQTGALLSDERVRMLEIGKNLQGQIVDGKFPLRRLLGGSNDSLVFLTEQKQAASPAAIKLIPVKSEGAAVALAALEAAASLSHPHLIQLFEVGQCQFDDKTYLYAVMEYAEEDLSQILPTRPLTAEETREMLPPVLAALRYLHRAGFVHHHIKPSNIAAIGDQIKISSDGVVSINQGNPVLGSPSPYDRAEIDAGLSPAADIWSLGVTLVEVLTQRKPGFDDTGEPVLPESVPAPFSEIVRQCLHRDPKRRWTVEEIDASLHPPAPSQPVNAVPPKQRAFGKLGWAIAGAVLVLILLALVASVAHRTPAVQKSSSTPPQAAAPQPAPAEPPTKPSAEVPQNTEQPDAAASTRPPSQPEEATNPGGVLQKALPTVPRSASNTIQGTIRVTIRVAVDASGNVSTASFTSSGPSKYFANLAMQAARRWTFVPVKNKTQDASREWILKFEFRRSGTRAFASGPTRQ